MSVAFVFLYPGWFFLRGFRCRLCLYCDLHEARCENTSGTQGSTVVFLGRIEYFVFSLALVIEPIGLLYFRSDVVLCFFQKAFL